MLSSTSATTLLPTGVERTWEAVNDLVQRLWPCSTEVLGAEAPRLLVHSVCTEPGGEPDAWLTWALEPREGCATRVLLIHDEQADWGPPPELDGVLLCLLARCLDLPGRVSPGRGGG